jgi:hypothetical protein
MDENERHAAARGGPMIECHRSLDGEYRLQVSLVLERDERAGTWVSDEFTIDELDQLIDRLVQGRDHLRRHHAAAMRGPGGSVSYMTPDSTPDEVEHEAPVRFVWTR